MRLEPILNAKLEMFKQKNDCKLEDDAAFERFANWTILERHQPGAFTADPDLMESVSVGGENDTGIDGVCIKINGLLVKSLIEVQDIVRGASRIKIDYIFIQSKNNTKFKQADYNQYLTGIKEFLREKSFQPQNEKLKEWGKIKTYLMGTEVCLKWEDNPSIYVYYVYLGENQVSEQIKASKALFLEEIKRFNSYGKIFIEDINAERLKKYCDENENNYEASINVLETCSFLGENEQIQGINSNSTIAVCRANELLKLLMSEDKLLRKGIFDDNVRDFQGETAINNEIYATIRSAPMNFVLYNNGITIVCESIITNGKSLIVKNPRIVNGCQTCNVIYNAKLNPEVEGCLSNIKVVLKIIATSNEDIINQVVRGTNKQNIVQDEAFETIREFHKRLEEFFLAANNAYAMPYPIFYERRSKQYHNINGNIQEIAKIKFSVLIKGFIGVFLGLPHKSINHPATLQKEYKRKIFLDKQSLLPYYTAAQISVSIENSARKGKLSNDVKSFKPQLAYLFSMKCAGLVPNINNSKHIDGYCEKILDVIKDQNKFNQVLDETVALFRAVRKEWVGLKGAEYASAIKDRAEFTEELKKRFIK